MKAIQLTAFGGPEQLTVTEIEKPKPAPTEVLVKVAAAAINPVEKWVRAGFFPWDSTLPLTPGWDFAGVVEYVEPGTSRFQVGDRVYGMPRFPYSAATYAEYVVAPSRQLALAPQNIDLVHAAALPMAVLTAWQSLVDVANVQPGQRVLIHGAGGGVGHLAVQIAKQLGAWVAATASTDKVDFVKSLGADQVIDYRTTEFDKNVGDLDLVIESIGGANADRSIPLLRANGMLLTLVQRTDADLKNRVQLAGKRFGTVAVEPDGDTLTEISHWIEQGRLRVFVSEIFALEDAAEAHRRLDRSITGKVVLKIADIADTQPGTDAG